MSLDQAVDMLKLVHRIEWLETEVRRYAAEAVLANTRIEALEAALQFITDGYDNQDIDHVDYRVRVYQVARAALDEDEGQ